MHRARGRCCLIWRHRLASLLLALLGGFSLRFMGEQARNPGSLSHAEKNNPCRLLNSMSPKSPSSQEPTFTVPVIKLRQADGSLLVKAGRPEVVEAEVSVAQFHRETGVSKRHIATLCEQGFIKHRRLTPKKDSKILIPRSEVDRFRSLEGEV